MESTYANKIFTIGHSNHTIEHFLSLLEKHHIDVLVDTRSSPFSKFSPQFNQQNLKLFVQETGKKYLFLGLELGGKPKDQTFYDDDGYVLYWKIAESELFQSAIRKIRNGIKHHAVAVLCSEEDPLHCHRRLLIGRVLQEQGVDLLHIRGNGEIQPESEIAYGTGSDVNQLNIFGAPAEEQPWRSIQSVSQKKPQLSSLAP
ncbi:MAG: DUF488 domain-containing protein [Candidatus Obscuribacterales bacterium]